MTDYPRLSTDVVRLTVRFNGRKKTFWAKPMKQRKPGIRTFLKVDNQGEVTYTYDQKTNTETKHLNIYVVAETDIVSEQPAIYSCKYAELEVA